MPSLLEEARQLHFSGRLPEALDRYDQLIAGDPKHIPAIFGAAIVHQALGHIDRAEALVERGYLLDPLNADFHNLHGTLLWSQKRGTRAVEKFRYAIALDPARASKPWFNLGIALTEFGDVVGATHAYEQAIAIEPLYYNAGQNLVFLRDVAEDSDQLFIERERFAEKFAAPLRPQIRPHTNTRNPDKRLKIGYISGDFWVHSAAFIWGPMLLNHDWDQVQVYAYHRAENTDPLTDLFRNETKWRHVVGLSEPDLVEGIRSDGIDILVDLSGFSHPNNYRILACKPAPVQVTAWGHALGMGLPTVDYIFLDPLAAPPAMRSRFTEEVIDLPNLMCYQQPGHAGDVGPLPALRTGYITFGSFNRVMKITPATLDMWAEILRQVPNARLMLKYGNYNTPETVARMHEQFRQRGIESHRLDMRGLTPQARHFETYNEVDIGLDPFPHGGGMTTLESLLMGVPVVTRAGTWINARTGVSVLTTVGLPDWIAPDADGYVKLAVERAQDLQALAALRARLRPMLLASPICQVVDYTRAVEAQYREMWRRWCAGDGEHTLRGGARADDPGRPSLAAGHVEG